MLKCLYVLLIDVAIGASIPQNHFILPPTPPPTPYGRPNLPRSSQSHTHVRITRPQHYDSILGNTQNPSQNIQFASSPSPDYYGGSVYSDGNGIVVRPQNSFSKVVGNGIVVPQDRYSQVVYSQPEISYFPSYPKYFDDRSLTTDPYYLAANYPSYSRGYDLIDSANMFNKPGMRAESGLQQYYSAQPIPAFAPQSRDLLMHGLGRVLPLNHMKKKRPVEVRSGADQEVLMFTLGRIMGQLNSLNNKTIPTPIWEYAIGSQLDDSQPTTPWANQVVPSVNPWLVASPSYQGWASQTTPWWQPNYTPWQPGTPWWANVYQPPSPTKRPWWIDLIMPKQDTPTTDTP